MMQLTAANPRKTSTLTITNWAPRVAKFLEAMQHLKKAGALWEAAKPVVEHTAEPANLAMY